MGGFFKLALLLAAFLPGISMSASKRIDPTKVEAEKVRMVQDYDKFQGHERWAAQPKPIGGTGFLNQITVNPVFFRKENGLAGYYMMVKYNGFGWLFLSGKVIFLLGDGSRIELVDEHPKIDTDIGGCSAPECLVTEVIRLPIPKADLERLSSASTVEVAVYGRNSYMSGYFKPHQQATVRAVLRIGEKMGGESLPGGEKPPAPIQAEQAPSTGNKKPR